MYIEIKFYLANRIGKMLSGNRFVRILAHGFYTLNLQYRSIPALHIIGCGFCSRRHLNKHIFSPIDTLSMYPHLQVTVSSFAMYTALGLYSGGRGGN